MTSASLYPPRWRDLNADETDTRLTLTLAGQTLLDLQLERGTSLHLSLHDAGAQPTLQALWAACYWLLASDPQRQQLTWHLRRPPSEAVRSGLLHSTDIEGQFICQRSLFWQRAQPWLGDEPLPVYPQQHVISAGKRHPLRGPKPQGEVYRRFDVRLGVWVSLRTLDIDVDLERFSRWQNTPRVMDFWEEGGSLEQHRQFLEKLAADPHTLTLFGCFDDQPFAYFEAYWAKEDRIAPFYEVDDYDRGIHMLVGEQAHRGPHKVASWLSALTHYLFLADPRTRRVVAEPRADNDKMIGYMQAQGYHCEKAFDFPHKRAALMMHSRERFFDRCALT